jgi:hypothetical protein
VYGFAFTAGLSIGLGVVAPTCACSPHRSEPGTLKQELRERYSREHADDVVRYIKNYRRAAEG